MLGGCRAPTPHRSRAAEEGADNKRLTQVCGPTQSRKGAQGRGGRVPPPQLGIEGSQVASCGTWVRCAKDG